MGNVRRGGGFGVIVLLIVVAVILLLATKAWKNATPTALEISRPASDGREPVEAIGAPSGDPGAGQQRALTGLSDMKGQTDRHTGQVRDALRETE